MVILTPKDQNLSIGNNFIIGGDGARMIRAKNDNYYSSKFITVTHIDRQI